MNKIFNINLGGYPFTIDDDAYTVINKYLNTINRHFSNSEGCDDILSDIETRIAELFNEHLKGQPIVSIREVDKVIAIMGKPEEFGAQDIHDDEPSQSHTKEYKTGKRFFRDPDEKIIGGVCAGLASYLGISDPVWLRIAFALSLFMAGTGVLLYVILWAAIPVAKTSGDKLAMKGERINVSNIAKKVEEEINNLSDTISELTKEFNSKKKG